MKSSTNSPSKRRSSFAFLKGKPSPSKTEASPVIDKIATKALSSALLDGDEVKALSAYTSVDKTTGISLDVELHPSLPLAGLAGNDAGHTPLHLAAAGCMPNILASFMEHGGSPNTLNALNQTSLHAACGGLRVDRTDGLVGRALQSLWGRVVKRGSSGSSNGGVSATLGNSTRARARAECVGRLLAWRGLEIDGDSERPAVNAVDRFGNTALHYACRLHSSSSSNEATSGGVTDCEMVSSRRQGTEVLVQQLLGRGALLTLVNGEGETAVDCAGRGASSQDVQAESGGASSSLRQPVSRLRRLSLSPGKLQDAANSSAVAVDGSGNEDGNSISAESAAAAGEAEALVDALEALVVFAVDLREPELRPNLLQELHEQQMQHRMQGGGSNSSSSSSSNAGGAASNESSGSGVDSGIGVHGDDGWGALRSSDEVLAWARNAAASARAALQQEGLIHCTTAGAELLLVACAWDLDDLLMRFFSGGSPDSSSSPRDNSAAEENHEYNDDDDNSSRGILAARQELLAAAGLSDAALAHTVLGLLTGHVQTNGAAAPAVKVSVGARVLVDVSGVSNGEETGDSLNNKDTSEPVNPDVASEGNHTSSKNASNSGAQWMAGSVVEVVEDVVLVHVDDLGADVDVPFTRLRVLLPLTTEDDLSPPTTTATSSASSAALPSNSAALLTQGVAGKPCTLVCAICGDEAPVPQHSPSSSRHAGDCLGDGSSGGYGGKSIQATAPQVAAETALFLVPNEGCAHAFCADCWLGHLRVQLREGAGAEPKCAAPRCPMPVGEGVAARALRSLNPREMVGVIAAVSTGAAADIDQKALNSISNNTISSSAPGSPSSFESEEARALYTRWCDVRASSIVERATCLTFCPSNACSAAVLRLPTAATKRESNTSSSSTHLSRENQRKGARQRRLRGGHFSTTSTNQSKANEAEEAEEETPPEPAPALDACCLACHKAPWCWTCGSQDAHAPCPCKEWEEWAQQVREHVIAAQKALGEDASSSDATTDGGGGGFESIGGGDARDLGNLLWLAANTKKCPQCKAFIEKDDGCNHMACKRCRHDFCWICMQPWREHSNKTGGYYKCNRFVEDGDGASEGGSGSGSGAGANSNTEGVNAPNDTENRGHGSAAEEARRANEEAKKAGRFIHHYTRFAAQGESHKMEQARVPRALARIAHLQSLASSAAAQATSAASSAASSGSASGSASGSGSSSNGDGSSGGGSSSGGGHTNKCDSLLAAMVEKLPGAAEQLAESANASEVDATKALTESFRELGRCRLLLRNSYAFAFFAYDPARLLAAAAERHGAEYTKRRYYRTALRERLRARRSAYEALQSELEMRTETMSEIVARRFLRASVREVQSATRAAAQYRADFLALLEEPVPLPEPSVSTVLGGHRNSSSNYSSSSYSTAPFGLYGFAGDHDLSNAHYYGNWNAPPPPPPQGRPPYRNRVGLRSQQGWPLSADWHDTGPNDNDDDDYGASNAGDASLPENEGTLQAFLETMARQHNVSSSSASSPTNTTSRDHGEAGEADGRKENDSSGDVAANGRKTACASSAGARSRSQLSRRAQALLEDNEETLWQERAREQERIRERRRRRHEREAAVAAEAVAKAEAQAAAIEEQEMMAQMLMMEGALGENTVLSEEQELARAILMSLGNDSNENVGDIVHDATINSGNIGAEGVAVIETTIDSHSGSSRSSSTAVRSSEHTFEEQRSAIDASYAVGTHVDAVDSISRDALPNTSLVNYAEDETSFEAHVDLVDDMNGVYAAATSIEETAAFDIEVIDSDAGQAMPPASEIAEQVPGGTGFRAIADASLDEEAYPADAEYTMAVVPLRAPGPQSRLVTEAPSSNRTLVDKHISKEPLFNDHLMIAASADEPLAYDQDVSVADPPANHVHPEHESLEPASLAIALSTVDEDSLPESAAMKEAPAVVEYPVPATPPFGPTINEDSLPESAAMKEAPAVVEYPVPATPPFGPTINDLVDNQPSMNESTAEEPPTATISPSSAPPTNDTSSTEEHRTSDPSANYYQGNGPSSSMIS